MRREGSKPFNAKAQPTDTDTKPVTRITSSGFMHAYRFVQDERIYGNALILNLFLRYSVQHGSTGSAVFGP